MTEHDLDSLASDLLDGLLPAEQAADALRDPAVARRVEEMRAAQALLRSVPAPDPNRREAAIAAALEAATGPVGDPSPTGTSISPATAGAPPPAVAGSGAGDLAAHRARARRRPSPWLAAAAVILVVLALGGLIATSRLGSGNDADTAAVDEASGDSRADSATSAEENAEGGEATADAAPTTTAPTAGQAPAAAPSDSADADRGSAAAGEPQALDLGAADSVDQLADRARGRSEALAVPGGDAETQDSLATSEGPAFTGCPVPSDALAGGGGTLDTVAVATLDGQPVTVWVFSDGGSERMVVLDSSCEVVGRRSLD